MVSGSDSALLYALAAWFLFIVLGKLKQLPDLSLSPPFSPFLSPFLLLVEMLWYREEQGRIQEKGRDRMGGKREGKSNRDQEREGGRGSGANFQGCAGAGRRGPPPLPLTPRSLLAVRHGSAVPAPWPGWAPSLNGFVRVSLSPFCGSCHLQVLSSPLAQTPKPAHRCLRAHLLSSSWFLLSATFFRALSTATEARTSPLSVPALPQAHFPLLLPPSDWVLHSWSRESQGLCSREPPCQK